MKIHHFESISRNSNCKIQFANHSKHVNLKKAILYYNCKRIYSNTHTGIHRTTNVSASFYMSKPKENVEMRRKVNEKILFIKNDCIQLFGTMHCTMAML